MARLPKHIRICPQTDGTVKYFPWKKRDEDYGDEIPAPVALRAIAQGATAEMAIVSPDDEHLPPLHQPVYETQPFSFLKL